MLPIWTEIPSCFLGCKYHLQPTLPILEWILEVSEDKPHLPKHRDRMQNDGLCDHPPLLTDKYSLNNSIENYNYWNLQSVKKWKMCMEVRTETNLHFPHPSYQLFFLLSCSYPNSWHAGYIIIYWDFFLHFFFLIHIFPLLYIYLLTETTLLSFQMTLTDVLFLLPNEIDNSRITRHVFLQRFTSLLLKAYLIWW